jgi:hypothetical protein
MRRLLKIIIGLLLVAAVGAALAVIVPWWFAMAGAQAAEVTGLIGLATLAMMGLFVLGEVIGFHGHGYYVIVGGACYLVVDLLMSLNYGIKLGPKFWQSGFVPLSIFGMFVAPVYRVITMPPFMIQRDPR